VERVQPDLAEAPALARRLERESPDAVIYNGIGGDPAATMLAAVAEGPLARRPLIAAGPLGRPGALPAGGPPRPLEVVTPMLPRGSYPPAGRRILRRLGAKHGAPQPVEALYGYESMRVVLRALRAAGRRATDRRAVIEAARATGPRGSVIGRYTFDDRGDTSSRRLALYSITGGRVRYRGPAPGSGRQPGG
jgi:branched-chain amino acid transport system substrate-binding protein